MSITYRLVQCIQPPTLSTVIYLIIVIHLAKTDIPPSQPIRVSFVIEEELHPGTMIGNVLAQLNGSSTPIYQSNFMELKASRFIRFNQTSGELVIQSRIDRENLCTDSGVCCPATTGTNPKDIDLSLLMRAEFRTFHGKQPIDTTCSLRIILIQQPEQDRLVEVIVYIVDINDNVPSWTQKVLEIEVPEHVQAGHTIKLPEATDRDQGPLNTVTEYRLFNAELQADGKQLSCIDCPHSSRMTDTVHDFSTDLFRLDYQPIHNIQNPAVRKFDLFLRISGELDREKQAIHYLILTAIDGQDQSSAPWTIIPSKTEVNSRNTGTLTIKVVVVDINDQIPKFINEQPVITVAENTQPGTVIYQAGANDLDISDANKLIYKINSAASAEVLRCFHIEPVTGIVRLKAPLNRHNATILQSDEIYQTNCFGNAQSLTELGYTIPLEVTDGIHTGLATLKVKLGLVNYKAPQIHISSHLRMSSVGDRLWITEDTPIQSIIAIVQLTDPDKPMRTGDLSNSLTTVRSDCVTTDEYFVIKPLFPGSAWEFKLVLNRKLDRETRDDHSVRIECWDSGTPPMSSELNLSIHIEDINDSPPIFEQVSYTGHIKEGSPINTLVLRVQATDADIGTNAQIFYRVVEQRLLYSTPLTMDTKVETALVNMHPTTGEIFTNVMFDRETTRLINLTIEASNEDNGVPALHLSKKQNVFHTYANVVINIVDINDCKPEFNSTSYEFSIPEGQPPHSKIGQVFATDKDAEPQNNVIRYAMHPITGSTGRLAKLYVTIKPDGTIYTHNSRLDREQTPVLHFEVIAMDTGVPALSASVPVTIHVLDVNDNSPIWLFPKKFGTKTVVNVSRQTTIGSKIAQLKAVDPDDGLNGEVIYSILHGNENGMVELDSISGAMYLSKSLFDFSFKNLTFVGKSRQAYMRFKEADEVVILKMLLQAADRGSPSLSNTTVLHLAISMYADQDSGSLTKSAEQQRGIHPGHDELTNLEMRRARFDHDLTIMIVLIVLTCLISAVLVMAICLVRCKVFGQTTQRSRVRSARYLTNDTQNRKQMERSVKADNRDEVSTDLDPCFTGCTLMDSAEKDKSSVTFTLESTGYDKQNPNAGYFTIRSGTRDLSSSSHQCHEASYSPALSRLTPVAADVNRQYNTILKRTPHDTCCGPDYQTLLCDGSCLMSTNKIDEYKPMMFHTLVDCHPHRSSVKHNDTTDVERNGRQTPCQKCDDVPLLTFRKNTDHEKEHVSSTGKNVANIQKVDV